MLTVVEGCDMRAAALTEWSEYEFRNDNDGLVTIRRSRQVWSLKEDDEVLLVCGIYAHTLISIPEVWLLLCKGFTRKLQRNIRFVHRGFDMLKDDYPTLHAKVDVTNPAALKFAHFMGFTEISREWLSDGREYIRFEVRNGR